MKERSYKKPDQQQKLYGQIQQKCFVGWNDYARRKEEKKIPIDDDGQMDDGKYKSILKTFFKKKKDLPLTMK